MDHSNGRWLVIQRRVEGGRADMGRYDYDEGFGDICTFGEETLQLGPLSLWLITTTGTSPS